MLDQAKRGGRCGRRFSFNPWRADRQWKQGSDLPPAKAGSGPGYFRLARRSAAQPARGVAKRSGMTGVALIVLIVLTFSLYQKTKSLQEDLTAIREKLGLLRPEELAERELQRAMEAEADAREAADEADARHPELDAINREIEQELEQAAEDGKPRS
ncbi:hypothetical protein HGI30_17385 [Paenibacillus albicereus]|uniref:Uncharacterized protein n=1 Tax=Paenibacillus albicereus TaxID=2726185 RepID=A0A6H2H1E0_9BACL|nr:hypothetical protein [Paenibacillus albicereus]QJC53168.1 hypothetical protein HGI30_17385 [Paenibacillus albicereus]